VSDAVTQFCIRCNETWFGGYHICPKEVPNEEGFIKHDQEKPVYALLPPEFEEAVAQVLSFGSQKYTDDNWQKCKTPWRTYYSALRRHLAASAKGETVDSESGLSHLAHAACCLAFLHWFESHGLLVDRPTPGPVAEGSP
jgi:hypothetical protein